MGCDIISTQMYLSCTSALGQMGEAKVVSQCLGAVGIWIWENRLLANLGKTKQLWGLLPPWT